MNIHEDQAKELFRQFGVTIQSGGVARTAEEAASRYDEVAAAYGPNTEVVIKAQIHAGGRGKGGGIKFARTREECVAAARKLIGMTLVTPQTGAQGRLVRSVLIVNSVQPQRELYFAVLLDRVASRPVVIASTEGGVDIEGVAAKTPEKILKEVIDPALGMMPFQARKLCRALGLTGDLAAAGAKLMLSVYRLFWESDCSLVEINPLVVTTGPDGKPCVLAMDAKINFDDNALYRHKDIAAMRDTNEEDPREVEASKNDLNYIGLDGTIGCMVNGAGLAMATMDIIKHYGGSPANFLDVGGGASVEQVTAAFKLLCGDKNVKALLVNIFGGIMKCDVLAAGIVGAAKAVHIPVPLVVRLEGTNVEQGRKMLKDSGLPIITATGMGDAAEKVVRAAKGNGAVE
ncbi:MAG: succinate--CoA ligase subunit beta [Verrucomicrobia bacterium GWF2_62_7]|nr:MAG: succinate--CoA ligase subunit beta [Verrucomicrobia bacterium GWF2_62_7]